jgi:hypothetical protein
MGVCHKCGLAIYIKTSLNPVPNAQVCVYLMVQNLAPFFWNILIVEWYNEYDHQNLYKKNVNHYFTHYIER